MNGSNLQRSIPCIIPGSNVVSNCPTTRGCQIYPHEVDMRMFISSKNKKSKSNTDLKMPDVILQSSYQSRHVLNLPRSPEKRNIHIYEINKNKPFLLLPIHSVSFFQSCLLSIFEKSIVKTVHKSK